MVFVWDEGAHLQACDRLEHVRGWLGERLHRPCRLDAQLLLQLGFEGVFVDPAEPALGVMQQHYFAGAQCAL